MRVKYLQLSLRVPYRDKCKEDEMISTVTQIGEKNDLYT